jgi:tetratricopeptide (TPR) repeat protein
MRILTECDLALGARSETATLREGLVYTAAQNSAKAGDFSAAVQGIENYLASLPQTTMQQKTVLRGYILQWAQQCMQQAKYAQMVSLLDKAARSGQDGFVDSMRLHLITEAAKNISRTQGYTKGYSFFDQNYPTKLENDAIRQNRLHLYGLWITDRIDVGKYEEAYLLNRSLVEMYPSNTDVRNNASWVVQRWMASMSSSSSAMQSIPVMLEMYRKYREPIFIDELVNETLRESNRLQQNRQYERAENLVQKARDLSIDGEAGNRLANMHRVIMFNWSIFHAKRDEYIQSIDIGKRALTLFPKDKGLEANLISFYYNAGLTLINTKQYDRAKQLLDEGLALFPRNANLTKLEQYLR